MYNSLVKSNDKSVTGVVYPEHTYYMPVKDLGYLPRVEFEEVKDKLLNDVEHIKSTSNPFLIQRYMDGIGVGTIAMVSNESAHQMSFQSQVINFQAWNNADEKKTMAGISVSGKDGAVIVQSNGGKIVFPSGVSGTVALEGAVAQSSDLSIIATFNITEANTVITLQDLIGMTSIDWGDGTTDSNLTHTYTAIGEYTCKIYGVTSIGSGAFRELEKLEDVYIGGCVTNIGEYAFYSSGLKRLNIDNGVTVIGRGAFNTCVNLTSVTIPNSVNIIYWGAFANCTSIVSVTIGDGVASIGESAFQNCPQLQTINVSATTPPTLGDNVFLYCYNLTKNIVPIESLETYKTANRWSDYATLICSYVTSLDEATQTKVGLISYNSGYGMQKIGSALAPLEWEIFITNRTNAFMSYRLLDKAVKAGVTTNTETLSDEEKASACGWLGALKKPANPSRGSLVNMQADGEVGTTAMVHEKATSWSIALRDDDGCIKTATPKASGDSANKGYVDNKFDIIDSILSQSGISYQADIVDTYTERITADGENVFDGSKAILKKVVGNTVACRNLANLPKLTATKTSINITEYLSDFINAFIQAPTGMQFTASAFVNALSVVNNPFDIRLRYINTSGSVESLYLTKSVGQTLPFQGKLVSTISKPENFSSVESIIFNTGNDTGNSIENFQIEYGTTATEYQPYFTGLKSASFSGIESTNADGTETSTLAFPKTETPLGTTIDFENKKITDYGVDLVLTGTEQIEYRYGGASYGNYVQIVGVLPTIESMAIYVSTDGDNFVVGANSAGNATMFWTSILDNLGYTTAGTQATAEEQATAIANFKAYLAQRYADGNPVTIRYVSSELQSETDFTADNNEYTAWVNGTEKVLENDGAEFNADNTLTQNYLFVKEEVK